MSALVYRGPFNVDRAAVLAAFKRETKHEWADEQLAVASDDATERVMRAFVVGCASLTYISSHSRDLDNLTPAEKDEVIGNLQSPQIVRPRPTLTVIRGGREVVGIVANI